MLECFPTLTWKAWKLHKYEKTCNSNNFPGNVLFS